MPMPLRERLYAQLVGSAREPGPRERLAGLGYTVVARPPAEFDAQVQREIVTWSDIFDKAGVKPE
jgi:tripartite-type tricarboxylate transporter receptor subunit TctC